MIKLAMGALAGAAMVFGTGVAQADTSCSCVVSSGAGQVVGTLASANGSVFVKSAKGYVAPSKAVSLSNGSQIAVGEGGSAVLNFAGGCSVSATSNTMITVSAMESGSYCVRSAELSLDQSTTFGQVGVGVGAGLGLGGGTGLAVGIGSIAVVGGIGVGVGAAVNDDSLNGDELPAGARPVSGPGSNSVSN